MANGVLDYMNDPASQGLLSLASGLLKAGGPQPFPVSFGQAVGQGTEEGLGSYNRARQLNAIEGLRQAQVSHLGMSNQLLEQQIAKAKQSAALMQQYTGGGALDISNPDVMDKIAMAHFAAGDHVNAAAMLNASQHRRDVLQQQNALTSMQSSPGMLAQPAQAAIPSPPDELGGGPGQPAQPAVQGTPAQQGMMGPLLNSPHVGPAAQQLQQAIDSRAITAKDAIARFEQLNQLHTTQTGQATGRQENFENRQTLAAALAANRPAPAVTAVDIVDPKDPSKVIKVDARTGAKIGDTPANKTRNPMAIQLFHDYSNNPEVKTANELAPKIEPLQKYMAEFERTGKSVNTNDEALAKAFVAITSKNSRAYNMDRKALANLPDLPSRVGNMLSSFFAGKDLTDQTRAEMWNYIKSEGASLARARAAVRAQTAARAKANMIPEDQVFGEPQ